MVTDNSPRAALQRHFGFREFLEGQESVIRALLDGQDALVIMPTGGGKSLCYQLPALLLDGITVVVSPLIALMKDQVDSLAARNIPATFINSSLSQAEMEERLAQMQRGEFRLVYIAPERFKSDRFTRILAPLSIALFAVDEAHCISQWGHDFRPDYMRLKWALKELGQPQVIALTATATPDVRDDILLQLELGKNNRRPPQVFVSGFARHNLTLGVTPVASKKDKIARLGEFVRQRKTGIIYCATRKNVEKVATDLAAQHVRAIYYHGAMTEEQRTRAQDKFMGGDVRVAVATNAFGMGIDRADLRFVVHYDICGSVEAYYQEAGRAGRDSEPAYCEMLFNYADVRTQEFFIDGANPTRGVIANLHQALRRLCAHGPVEIPISEIAEQVPAANNDMAVGSALFLLQRAGYIARDYRTGSRTYTTRLIEPVKSLDELEIDFAKLEAKRDRDLAKLRRVIDYAYCKTCRHQFILRYFGDSTAAHRCAACDNCQDATVTERKRIAAPSRPRAASKLHSPAPARGDRRREDALPDWAKEFTTPRERGKKQVLIQKALSCVARMKGRFGIGRITLVLVGSRSKEVFDAKLDQLSTYGLLQEYGYDFTLELLRCLANAGCIELSGGKYATASLTPLGVRAMHAKAIPDVDLPHHIQLADNEPQSRVTLKAASASAENSYDDQLFESLRQWRRQLASRMGVPAFVIYPDKTLQELSRHKPTTDEELLRVRGIGPVKARQFGKETLAVIRESVA